MTAQAQSDKTEVHETRLPSVLIEGGHLYLPLKITDEIRHGADIANNITLVLRGLRLPTSQQLFVDDAKAMRDFVADLSSKIPSSKIRLRDFHFIRPPIESAEKLLTDGRNADSNSLVVVHEYHLNNLESPDYQQHFYRHSLYNRLIELNGSDDWIKKSIRLNDSKTTLIIGSGKRQEKIKLMGKEGHSDLMSCDLLDAANYEIHADFFRIQITVLPLHMKPQQERVRLLLEALGLKVPILNVYFGKDGQVCEFDCGDSKIADIMKSIIKRRLAAQNQR
ncbi:MAG: hypothetical protein R3A13_01825 [Bdellovibrionota bacterium]